LLKLPPAEQAAMVATLASVADDVSKAKPVVREAYEAVVAGAQRTRRSTDP
jgi:hypothetical protein